MPFIRKLFRTSTMSFKPVTHVIFDMDGLLLNTEDIYTQAFQNIVSPYGKVYGWDTKVLTMGLKLDKGAQIIIDKMELPLTVEELIAKLNEQLYDLFSKSKLLPGAEKLISHLIKHKIPTALCTGSSDKAYDAKTMHHKEFFKAFVPKVKCSDDPEVKFGKPHPDAYDVTRRRFTPVVPEAEKCLVFEDAYNGVLSGLAAGMQVVMVPDERVSKDHKDKATLCLKSLLDFKPEDFGLPAY